MKRFIVLLAGLTIGVMPILAACGGAANGSAAGSAAPPASASAPPASAIPAASASAAAASQHVTLTFWFWAESDAPGSDKWMAQTVKLYEASHPNITINVVPQSSDTINSAFQTAADAKSGPDIASLWTGAAIYDAEWSGQINPIDNYIPASEIKNWLSTSETEYQGKVWTMPLYHYAYGLAYNRDLLAKAGVTPPTGSNRWTWDQFLGACDKLHNAGITPIGGGNEDGWLGTYLLGVIGIQQVNSLSALLDAVVGKASFTDPSAGIVAFYQRIEDTIQHHCWNSDVSSTTLDAATGMLSTGKVAMEWGIDPWIKTWKQDLGASKVGVMRPPIAGPGALASVGQSTSSVGFFVTPWSKYQQQAAAFLDWALHTPANFDAFYQQTGTIPADSRFNTSQVTDPDMQLLAQWAATGRQIWEENWIPVEEDNNGDRPGGQMIFDAAGTPQQAAALWQQAAVKWREQNPQELANWQKLLQSLNGS